MSAQEAKAYADSRQIMYFEVSARMGHNITLTFNEVAKKLTGIETNPIQRSEVQSAGFTLNQAPRGEPEARKKQKAGCSC